MDKLYIIHFFSRTQLIFAVGAMLEPKVCSSKVTLILVPELSNGIFPHYDGIPELLEKNNFEVILVQNQMQVRQYISKKTDVTIFSPSTFPLELFIIGLRHGASISIVNIEEGIGSYLSNANGVISLLRRGWFYLAFRRVVALLLNYVFKHMGYVERKRLIKNNLTVCENYKNSIVSVLTDLHAADIKSIESKRRQLLLPIKLEEFHRWYKCDNTVFVKPHPRFSIEQDLPYVISSNDLVLTAEEVCIKHGIDEVISDHSSSLIYCSILCGTESFCDTANQWNITDATNLMMFDKFCIPYKPVT